MQHWKRVLVVALCATGCLTDVAGSPGEPGVQGPQGEQGPPGSNLVWKDASGEVLAGAIPEYHDRSYALVLRDQHGVFFSYSAATGVPEYAEVSTTGRISAYLTNNCSGPVQYWVDMPPGIAFKYNGRVVALPPDITISSTAGSYYYEGCKTDIGAGAWIDATTLNDLPTLTAPVLVSAPYHVDRL